MFIVMVSKIRFTCFIISYHQILKTIMTMRISYILQKLRLMASRDSTRVLPIIAYFIEYYFDRYRFRSIAHLQRPTEFVNQAISNLNKSGYHVIPNFISEAVCKDFRDKIDAAIIGNPELIHAGSSYDFRIFGIENLVNNFLFLTNHQELTLIASRYLGVSAKAAFTLGARLESKLENTGSGGGWHRDSGFRQIKAMLYLSDVAETNGPFQLLANSNKPIQMVKDNFLVNQKYGEVRWTEKLVDFLLNKTSKSRLKTFTAKAGTLLIFDSSAIHRGAPILEGARYALTNYYFKEMIINASIYDHFYPVAGHV